MADKLILVDDLDNVLGFEDKEKCHDGKGILHRAFSAFVFNNQRELLIQQRGRKKRLWPLYWSNTCCSHPRQGESYESSAARRLEEELGFSCRLKYLYKFQYQACFNGKGSENELCAVLIGMHDGIVIPNPEEIEDYRWVSLDGLVPDIKSNPGKYTPWFKLEIEELLSNYHSDINRLFAG
jgi:isopentenyl-diphosphate delta-isomerase